jgi:hypothetical protein
MAILHIEKLGGLAGYGGTNARIRGRGQIDTTALSPADQKAVDKLFKPAAQSSPQRGRQLSISDFRTTPTAPKPSRLTKGVAWKLSRHGEGRVCVSDAHIPLLTMRPNQALYLTGRGKSCLSQFRVFLRTRLTTHSPDAATAFLSSLL